MKKDELPPGWVRATLSDIGEIVSGATPKTKVPEYWGGSIPWLTPDDLSKRPAKYTVEGRRSLTTEGYNSCSARLVPEGSVLFSSRAPIGYVTIARNEICTNQGFKSVIPDKGIVLSDYLYWYLQFKTPDIEAGASGTTFKEISAKKFSQVEVLLPPIAEQERIVDALEDHLSRLDAAVGYLDAISQRAVQFRRAVVGGLVAGSSQNMTTIGDEFEVFVGATPSRKEPKNWHGDVPWVSSGEVAFTKIMETRERIAADAVGNKITRIHPPGTLLIAMIGEGKTRGQVAILGIEAAHNQNCASIRIDPEKAISEFVYYVLEHRYEESRKASSGGNQPALNKSKVKAIPLPLPDLEVQQRIVDEISLLDSRIKQVRSTAELAAARASRLRDSLLNKAFSGRLVSQDSADEPASALLERIKAERASQPKPTRKRAAKTATASTRPAPSISSDPAGTFVQEELGL